MCRINRTMPSNQIAVCSRTMEVEDKRVAARARLLKRRSRRTGTKYYREQQPVLYGTAIKLPSAPLRTPVFMLPRNDLATIPEDEEIHGGFFLRLSSNTQQLHSQGQMFWGMISLSANNKSVVDVCYRGFSCRIDGNIKTRAKKTILSRNRQAIRHQFVSPSRWD